MTLEEKSLFQGRSKGYRSSTVLMSAEWAILMVKYWSCVSGLDLGLRPGKNSLSS